VPSRTSRGWMWTVIMIASLEVAISSSVSAASTNPWPSSHFDSQAGSMSHDYMFERLPRSAHTAPFESLRLGSIDANLPPEALQAMALKYGADFAQALPSDDDDEFDDPFGDPIMEYDPWEGINRAIFSFNRQVDRYVFKPVATVWDTIIPDLAQQSFSNAFDNIAMPRRFINNVFQLKFEGAGRELARFFINISMGVLGFFDAAAEVGLPKITDEDTGQTLGHYGVRPGPYLVLPFLPPLTVRDAFGFAADSTMSPLSYVTPFEATAGMRGGQLVNERSLNLELFEQLERETFDLYTAVRNAYLQRRQRAVED
jgi:phospholipid-binding lipoprotein MlaA